MCFCIISPPSLRTRSGRAATITQSNSGPLTRKLGRLPWAAGTMTKDIQEMRREMNWNKTERA